MNYFAYGSNMLQRRLWRRIPEAKFISSPCHLSGYKLSFHKIGQDKSGKCNIFETGNANDYVEGVLFDLPQPSFPILDRYEGNGYSRKTIEIFDSRGNSIEAFTYMANLIDESLIPFFFW